MIEIIQRSYTPDDYQQLVRDGMEPILARLYAARGVRSAMDLQSNLDQLLAPAGLKNIELAAARLALAIERGEKVIVVGDYDCDGATACATAMRGLRALGARVDYLVPNRFEHSYGLSPEVVALAAARQPGLIVTVDNGIASVEGVQAAYDLGIEVIITDHHLPGPQEPKPAIVVNPNQHGCSFASKNLAGVGVIFYVLLALRSELRQRGFFQGKEQPRLDRLLDLVALGTVADLVKLDRNNRILVAHGLARMRSGQLQPGLAALFAVSGRDPSRASSSDLAFLLAPRINAAGRLADISLGIECLITDDVQRAHELAQQLDAMNQRRKKIENHMQQQALLDLPNLSITQQRSITLFNPQWHQGVIGIVAARLKDRFGCPAVALAPAEPNGNLLKGSGRSVPGLHLRDVLDQIAKQHPGLLLSFGGHAMAAGLTLDRSSVETFAQAFETISLDWLGPKPATRQYLTDGELEPGQLTTEFAKYLDQRVWGQGFAAPLFGGRFTVEQQSVFQNKHLKLQLCAGESSYRAVYFHQNQLLPREIYCAYRLNCNLYQGRIYLQLMVEAVATKAHSESG